MLRESVSEMKAEIEKINDEKRIMEDEMEVYRRQVTDALNKVMTIQHYAQVGDAMNQPVEEDSRFEFDESATDAREDINEIRNDDSNKAGSFEVKSSVLHYYPTDPEIQKNDIVKHKQRDLSILNKDAYSKESISNSLTVSSPTYPCMLSGKKIMVDETCFGNGREEKEFQNSATYRDDEYANEFARDVHAVRDEHRDEAYTFSDELEPNPAEDNDISFDLSIDNDDYEDIDDGNFDEHQKNDKTINSIDNVNILNGGKEGEDVKLLENPEDDQEETQVQGKSSDMLALLTVQQKKHLKEINDADNVNLTHDTLPLSIYEGKDERTVSSVHCDETSNVINFTVNSFIIAPSCSEQEDDLMSYEKYSIMNEPNIPGLINDFSRKAQGKKSFLGRIKKKKTGKRRRPSLRKVLGLLVCRRRVQ